MEVVSLVSTSCLDQECDFLRWILMPLVEAEVNEQLRTGQLICIPFATTGEETEQVTIFEHCL